MAGGKWDLPHWMLPHWILRLPHWMLPHWMLPQWNLPLWKTAARPSDAAIWESAAPPSDAAGHELAEWESEEFWGGVLTEELAEAVKHKMLKKEEMSNAF